MKGKRKVTVIGGGTGSFTVLSGLKHLESIDISAIIAVTDSGGSSGRLRDEYGILPVGDIRQALVALADANNGDTLMRKLFLYRFDRGDMEGHNFGNLFLTAMTDILGSEEKAIRYVSKVLKIKGSIIPITNKDIDLVAEYTDGSVLVGEAFIDMPDAKHDCTQKITKLKIQPAAEISTPAKEAILRSDTIILGPGDLYTSLLANFTVKGAKQALSSSKAQFIYITNLMSKYGQTHGMTARDHVEEVAKYAGRYPDKIIVSNDPLSTSILKRYEEEGAYPVIDDLSPDYDDITIRESIISRSVVPKVKGDSVNRSLIRHDSIKLANILKSIIFDR